MRGTETEGCISASIFCISCCITGFLLLQLNQMHQRLPAKRKQVLSWMKLQRFTVAILTRVCVHVHAWFSVCMCVMITEERRLCKTVELLWATGQVMRVFVCIKLGLHVQKYPSDNMHSWVLKAMHTAFRCSPAKNTWKHVDTLRHLWPPEEESWWVCWPCLYRVKCHQQALLNTSSYDSGSSRLRCTLKFPEDKHFWLR